MSATAELIDTKHTGAVFSPCRDYRYRLWRLWNDRLPPLTFLMLNPSTATEKIIDPTVRGCIARAQKWGYGALNVVNLFAMRSTNPRALYDYVDPVGPENDEHIREVTWSTQHAGGVVIAGWGAHGKLHDRGEQVRLMLEEMGVVLRVLKLNADGSPGHPLYISHDTLPTVWRL